jgi:glycosyltransferase involved in cell wall biosynthesis
MAALKVLYILPVGERGGAERIVESWAASHTSRVEPFVVMPEGPLLGSFRKRGVWAAAPPRFKMSNLHGSIRYLRALIVERGIDLIHSSMPKGHLFGSLAALASGRPELWFNHGPISPSYFQGLLPLLPTRAVLVNSQYMRRMQAATLFNARELRVQRLGVDTENIKPRIDARSCLRRRYGISDDTCVLGVFGRLVRWKGQDLLLKAIARMRTAMPDRKLSCFLIGGTLFQIEKEYQSELQTLAEQLNLRDIVIMTGHIDDVYDHFDLVDIVIHTSVIPEPFGLVVAEGMAKGKIVVATQEGGPGEMIEHGRTGFVYPIGNVDLLTATLNHVLELSDDERRRVAQAARISVSDHFSLSRSVESLEDLYEEMLSH